MLVKENIVYLFHAKLIVLEISMGFIGFNVWNQYQSSFKFT